MINTLGSEKQKAWIPVDHSLLEGDLVVPPLAGGLVIFAHGSGSSRFSPRNRYVAGILEEGGLATLLMDLLTEEEEERDLRTAELRFDIDLLASRVADTIDWVARQEVARELRIGLFGSSTGAAAALRAAAERPRDIGAVVSRGGRPDLAGDSLPRVVAATRLIVGGDDRQVLALNQRAFSLLGCTKDLTVVPGATHLFEEEGALAKVAELARDWFRAHLVAANVPREEPVPPAP